jgi:hypothetical protein
MLCRMTDILVAGGVQGVRAAVEKLTKSVDDFVASSNKYSGRLLGLTWAIAVLTFVMTVLATIMAIPIITGWISGGPR